MISKKKELDAVALLRDKIRGPWTRMPQWLKEAWPISMTPREEVTCHRTGSHILGVTENVANASGRGSTASGFLLDEAAFQDGSRDIWAAVMPMSKKLFAITTPSLSPGGVFIKAKLDEAEEGKLLLAYMRGNAAHEREASKRIPKAPRAVARKESKDEGDASDRLSSAAPFEL